MSRIFHEKRRGSAGKMTLGRVQQEPNQAVGAVARSLGSERGRAEELGSRWAWVGWQEVATPWRILHFSLALGGWSAWVVHVALMLWFTGSLIPTEEPFANKSIRSFSQRTACSQSTMERRHQ